MQFDTEMIEKSGILGLFYLVLAGIGVFIARVGFRMVDAIKENTGAVKDLAVNIKDLVFRHEKDAEATKDQVETSTTTILGSVKEGFREIREELQRAVHRNSEKVE